MVDSMRAVIDRAHEGLTAVIPAAELATLAGPLRAAAGRGVAVDLVTDPAVALLAAEHSRALR